MILFALDFEENRGRQGTLLMHLMHINGILQNGTPVLHSLGNVNLVLASSCKDKSPACMKGCDLTEVKGS